MVQTVAHMEKSHKKKKLLLAMHFQSWHHVFFSLIFIFDKEMHVCGTKFKRFRLHVGVNFVNALFCWVSSPQDGA